LRGRCEEVPALYVLHFQKKKGEALATKTIKVSDLTGDEIREEERLARIVVEEHPSITDSVTLEVLPEEVEGRLPSVEGYVRISYFPPTESGGEPQRLVMTLEDFNNLSDEADMEAVLENAVLAQQDEESKRRVRRGRRGAAEKRPRIDYTSPMHAGEPHRGRITDKEKEYVREHLEEVNTRLERDGHRTIDPNDPEMVERYGLEIAE
jgi:hypothetical protein